MIEITSMTIGSLTMNVRARTYEELDNKLKEFREILPERGGQSKVLQLRDHFQVRIETHPHDLEPTRIFECTHELLQSLSASKRLGLIHVSPEILEAYHQSLLTYHL